MDEITHQTVYWLQKLIDDMVGSQGAKYVRLLLTLDVVKMSIYIIVKRAPEY